MTLTRTRLAEKAAAVERHLTRVADRLPPEDVELEPATDTSDAVVLHLWQATQLVIDVALSASMDAGAAPATYADAFRRLAARGVIEDGLADRLVAATGFRNRLVHAYEELDLELVRDAATHGPADLRALLAAVRDTL